MIEIKEKMAGSERIPAWQAIPDLTPGRLRARLRRLGVEANDGGLGLVNVRNSAFVSS